MKIHGERVGGRARTVVLWKLPAGGEVELSVSALPLGFACQLRRRGVVMPVVPVRVARDKEGRPLKDGAGLAVPMEDRGDCGYMEAVERYHQRVAMLVLYEGLRGNAHWQWECVEPGEGGDWCRFADALFEELETAGVTLGEVVWLCETITALGLQGQEQVPGARDRFFLPA